MREETRLSHHHSLLCFLFQQLLSLPLTCCFQRLWPSSCTITLGSSAGARADSRQVNTSILAFAARGRWLESLVSEFFFLISSQQLRERRDRRVVLAVKKRKSPAPSNRCQPQRLMNAAVVRRLGSRATANSISSLLFSLKLKLRLTSQTKPWHSSCTITLGSSAGARADSRQVNTSKLRSLLRLMVYERKPLAINRYTNNRFSSAMERKSAGRSSSWYLPGIFSSIPAFAARGRWLESLVSEFFFLISSQQLRERRDRRVVAVPRLLEEKENNRGSACLQPRLTTHTRHA